jgi:hypothetical protein
MLPYHFPTGRYSTFGKWLAKRRLRKHRFPFEDGAPAHERCGICKEAHAYLVSIGERER